MRKGCQSSYLRCSLAVQPTLPSINKSVKYSARSWKNLPKFNLSHVWLSKCCNDGRFTKRPGQSLFYRPDGHPRSTAGQLILTQILDLQDTDAAPSLPSDFGQDLLKLPEAQAALWVKERAARCEGKWAAGAYKDTLSEMGYLFSKWRRGDLVKSSEND